MFFPLFRSSFGAVLGGLSVRPYLGSESHVLCRRSLEVTVARLTRACARKGEFAAIDRHPRLRASRSAGPSEPVLPVSISWPSPAPGLASALRTPGWGRRGQPDGTPGARRRAHVAVLRPNQRLSHGQARLEIGLPPSGQGGLSPPRPALYGLSPRPVFLSPPPTTPRFQTNLYFYPRPPDVLFRRPGIPSSLLLIPQDPKSSLDPWALRHVLSGPLLPTSDPGRVTVAPSGPQAGPVASHASRTRLRGGRGDALPPPFHSVTTVLPCGLPPARSARSQDRPLSVKVGLRGQNLP